VRYLLPLGLFVALAVFLGIGLKLDPREVPSPFIDKPAPALELPTLFDNSKTISNSDLKGKPWILNVWASWCVACRQEHQIFVSYSRSKRVPLVGLNYKDAANDAKAWLQELGNPYDIIAFDLQGSAGIEWGVYGVPETFVIDAEGIVRYKHIGPVSSSTMKNTIIPLLQSLQSNG
jgi:cytochrome c biogenesis protein CcmG, thiol:disulfide interchange protein DsbE